MSNSYSLLEQARKKSQNLFQSTSTIQSSTSEAESSLDVELFIELIRQFRVIRNPKRAYFKYHAKKRKTFGTKLTLLLVGPFQVRIFCKFFNKGVKYIFLFCGFLFYQKHSYKKRIDSLETQAVLLMLLLELEIFGVAVQSIHQNTKKW